MRGGIQTIFVLLIFFSVCSCLDDGSSPYLDNGTTCLLDRFVYHDGAAVDSSYLMHYNSAGQVDQVEKQYTSGNNWITHASFKHTYRKDTTIVARFPQGAQMMMGIHNGSRLQELRRFAGGNLTYYRYRFDFSVSGFVSVALDFVSNSTAQYVSHALYQLDANGNVSGLKIFDSPNATKATTEKTFVYDPSRNPQKDVLMFAFNQATVPGVGFLSASNVIKEQQSSSETIFTYQYNEYLMPREFTLPGGAVLQYTYNCGAN